MPPLDPFLIFKQKNNKPILGFIWRLVDNKKEKPGRSKERLKKSSSLTYLSARAEGSIGLPDLLKNLYTRAGGSISNSVLCVL